MKNKRLLALTLTLALGMSTATAMAAEAEESAPLSEEAFNDVPKGHWAYSALEVLSKDGVLEGYPDGSFKGDEPMTRYEMAKIIANAYKGGSFADDALIDGVRQELSGELKTLKKVDRQVKKNTNSIKKLENFVDRFEFGGFGQVRYENNDTRKYDSMTDNDRFYMSLKTNYKVNDDWKVCTEWEINHKYSNYRNFHGNHPNSAIDSNNPVYVGTDRQNSKFYPRLWMEGNLGKKLSMDVGRKWRGLGFQVMAYGEETDGITLNLFPAACACATYSTILKHCNIDISKTLEENIADNAMPWYLPSCGELGYMMVRLARIQYALSQADGIALGTNQILLSSTEYGTNSSNLVIGLNPLTGIVYSRNKNEPEGMVRPFAAY